MNGAPDSTRGVDDRGIGGRDGREANVPRGRVIPIVPDRTYNVTGFDIGSADLAKAGIKEELEPVVDRLHVLMGSGRRPTVQVTGHASRSTLPGLGPEVYAKQRAESIKAYLVSRGIPPDSISIATSQEGPPPKHAASAKSSAASKSAARSATIDIALSGQRPDVADRFGDIQYITKSPWPKLPKFPPLPPSLAALGVVAAGVMLLPGVAAVGAAAAIGLAEVLGVAAAIYGASKFPKYVKKYAGELISKFDPQHHILPQENLPQFNDVGINIHEWTKRIPKALHELLHKEWNVLWKVFFELHGGTATPDQIWQFAHELEKRWGIDKLPYEEYDWKKTPMP